LINFLETCFHRKNTLQRRRCCRLDHFYFSKWSQFFNEILTKNKNWTCSMISSWIVLDTFKHSLFLKNYKVSVLTRDRNHNPYRLTSGPNGLVLYYTWLEKLAKDNCSSLLRHSWVKKKLKSCQYGPFIYSKLSTVCFSVWFCCAFPCRSVCFGFWKRKRLMRFQDPSVNWKKTMRNRKTKSDVS